MRNAGHHERNSDHLSRDRASLRRPHRKGINSLTWFSSLSMNPCWWSALTKPGQKKPEDMRAHWYSPYRSASQGMEQDRENWESVWKKEGKISVTEPPRDACHRQSTPNKTRESLWEKKTGQHQHWNENEKELIQLLLQKSLMLGRSWKVRLVTI